tara:strand:+ start:23396 stop:24643 length:1248 start_codon:yes stop_codon:yes gene_type:complete
MFMKQSQRENKKRELIVFKTLFFFLLLFVGNPALTKSLSVNSMLTLKQVLAAAMEINDQKNGQHEKIKIEKPSWLASSPKIGVSYLKSDLQLGSNEAEVNISLPIKSWLQRDIDEKLYTSSHFTRALQIENKGLMLSGVIREQLWKIELAEDKKNNLKQKLSFLTKLEKQYQELFQSASINHYPLLLIKKEKLDSQMAQLEIEQTVAQLYHQYSLLTGFTSLPKDINEQSLESDISLNKLLTNHPQIKKLDQDWFEQKQQLKLTSNQSESWHLSINAKSLNTSNISETQLGIAAEVPLTIFNIKSQAFNSEWLMAKGNYDLNRANLLISLRDAYLSLRSNQQILLKKNDLLLQAKSLSKQIIAETQLLIEANQIDQDTAIRRMLVAFNTKSKLTTNQLLLLKTSALLNQAAGISL